MKNGDKINCPHCGEKSFVKEKKEFDDSFSLKERSFFCALCGGKLVPPSSSSPKVKNSSAADRLSALLGGEKVQKVSFEKTADDGHFCLHCVHYLKHPFMTRCALTLKEIEATDNCEKFECKDE